MTDDRRELTYDRVAYVYERTRPDYPPAILDALPLDGDAAVLDLGAGTGKLTRVLAARYREVTAVEPLPNMRAILQRVVPTAAALPGSAEEIPLEDASVDGVFAAQAFHWFDATAALPEIRRVLRPGGSLALLWNKRDEADPAQLLLAELTDPPERQAPRGWQLDIPAILGESGLFDEVETFEFPHVQAIDDEGFVDRLHSSSYVASLPPERRSSLEAQLRERLAELGSPHALAFKTLLSIAQRR